MAISVLSRYHSSMGLSRYCSLSSLSMIPISWKKVSRCYYYSCCVRSSSAWLWSLLRQRQLHLSWYVWRTSRELGRPQERPKQPASSSSEPSSIFRLLNISVTTTVISHFQGGMAWCSRRQRPIQLGSGYHCSSGAWIDHCCIKSC